MRLLCTATGHFIEVFDLSRLRYAILSHTWAPNGEQTYEDIRSIQRDLDPDFPVLDTSYLDNIPFPPVKSDSSEIAPSLANVPPLSLSILHDQRVSWKVSEKIRKACEVARAHGYRLIWIDSCCIDKTSSSELSEAINSMYAWYRDAAVCYAHLHGVAAADDPYAEDSPFRSCRWFQRGWTLQELIAPRALVFLSQDWLPFGTKSGLADAVEKATKIDPLVLTHEKELDDFSVASRMSWAAGRTTTRVEDVAYSLLGIFGINMPTLYGEGDRAFIRLQEEIVKRIPDQSIFVWGAVDFDPVPPTPPPASDPCGPAYPDFSLTVWPRSGESNPILASSPSLFSSVPTIRPIQHEDFTVRLGLRDTPYPAYSFTSLGLHTHLPVVPIRDCIPPEVLCWATNRTYRSSTVNWTLLAVLACEPLDQPGHLFAMICHMSSTRRLSCMSADVVRSSKTRAVRLILLAPEHLEACNRRLRPEAVYVNWRTSPQTLTVPDDHRLCMTRWCAETLKRMGYRHTFSNGPGKGTKYLLVLSKGSDPATTVKLFFRPGRDMWRVHIGPSHGGGDRGSPSTSELTLDMRKATDSKEFTLDFASEVYLTIRITIVRSDQWELNVDVNERNVVAI